MTKPLVPPVEPAGERAQKPIHSGDPIGLRRLDHEMKMIRPENVGMDLPAGLGAHLAQRLDEALPIRVIHENRFAPGYSTLNLRAIRPERPALHKISISRTDPFYLELAFYINALQTGLLPPTLNLDQPNPECGLDYVLHQVRERKINAIVNNSFDFDGHKAWVVARRFTD